MTKIVIIIVIIFAAWGLIVNIIPFKEDKSLQNSEKSGDRNSIRLEDLRK